MDPIGPRGLDSTGGADNGKMKIRGLTTPHFKTKVRWSVHLHSQHRRWGSRTVERWPKNPKLYLPTSPPPRFQDNLSTMPLTPNTLQELNRRTTQHGQRNAAYLSPTSRSRINVKNSCLRLAEQTVCGQSPWPTPIAFCLQFDLLQMGGRVSAI